MKYLFIFLSLIIFSCNDDQVENRITEITSDIDLYDDKTHTINSDISNINGSINLGGSSILIIENAILNFDLIEDLQYGIYLEDDAKIIIKGSTLQSANKQWEFELRGNAKIEVDNSFLKNHSAVKLFDQCTLVGSNSLIEELRMDNKGNAMINNCEIYPNMQFFFDVDAPLEFPDSYTKVNFIIDNTAKNGWKLDMKNSIAQGWQVDVKPGTDITIQNSIDVTLALWSNGSTDATLNLSNPSGSTTSFTITELGSNVEVINTEVFFMNIYLIENDKLTIQGEKSGELYNTKFLEILLIDNAELTIYDSHVFGQLFHINDSSKLTLHNCLVGSDDPDDPINSEFAIKNKSNAEAFDCEMHNTDIVINGTSKLELTDCNYDETRVSISDDGELVIH